MSRKLNTEEIERVSVEEFKQLPKIPLVIVLDNVRSMHNTGSIFRMSDAFCIEKIVLCGITATPPHNEIHKSALGAEYSVQWEYSQNAKTPIQKLTSEGYTAIAVEQTENSVNLNLFEVDTSKKYVIVFGNEVFGVEQDTIDACKQCIEIPQFGTKHSLNVSVAAGIVVWEFFKKLSIDL